ncbi:PRC-barrel domain-containing protein [Pedobacter jeongneungensis]|uniref:PRC-barrel domain-containing protein n=1 Tax=Pedobacter jeongneungensis TaxID=947309 RepID=UPI00046A759F|nr:PRC-barrel domain-containing protein [Pedobacter jeongneungensis]
MSTGSIEYLDLRELAHENYSIIDGESDITGWAVVDEGDRQVGKVRDLLFDPKENAVRYVIVDLDGSVLGIEKKTVLLPIGFITMGEEKKEVVIPVLHENQISLMPQYIIGEVTRDTEVQIRSAIGSPAALRIEEEITELEHSDFYQHHHFDRGNILSDKKEISHPENTAEPRAIDREEEQTTIHELIRSSKENGNDGDNILEGGDVKSLTVNTSSGSFKVEP